MTTTVQTAPVDHDKLMAFIGKVVTELGATVNAGLIVIGDRLGLYRALAAFGPLTAAQLAGRAGISAPYAQEWLNAQAAGGYAEYDPVGETYFLTAEQATALADDSSPAFVNGAFELALGALKATPAIEEAFTSGAGYGWHQHDRDVHVGCERFFRPGYNANLLTGWLPALDGVVDKLRAGVSVADVGCGLGASTRLMARAFPRSTFTGFDYHRGSIELARQETRAGDLEAGNLSFEVASASNFAGSGYELVTMFDCLHDMGDPVGVARHVREALASGGTWMIVEPLAADTVQGNLNPLGRAYYAFSTLLCTPNSLSQPVGAALGAQAGEARIHSVVRQAGFTAFRRAAESLMNAVYEVRP
jgi:SAM-dependent methyltransferase